MSWQGCIVTTSFTFSHYNYKRRRSDCKTTKLFSLETSPMIFDLPSLCLDLNRKIFNNEKVTDTKYLCRRKYYLLPSQENLAAINMWFINSQIQACVSVEKILFADFLTTVKYFYLGKAIFTSIKIMW